MKPDDKTWREYIYDDSDTKEEIRSKQDQFSEHIEEATRRALSDSEELDASRFAIEPGDRRLKLTADGWLMAEEEDVLRVRDALRKMDISDESVGVYSDPRSVERGGPAPLPPIVDEYEVVVQLHREVELFDRAIENSQL